MCSYHISPLHTTSDIYTYCNVSSSCNKSSYSSHQELSWIREYQFLSVHMSLSQHPSVTSNSVNTGVPDLLPSNSGYNTCISVQFYLMTNLTHNYFLYMFISILYMFQAFKCSSSGDSIVSIRYLVFVTLCR